MPTSRAIPSGTPSSHAVYAQTPMRFYDATFDAAPLFTGAQTKVEILIHILGTMLRGWDVAVGARALRPPILIAHGRHDYLVPWVLWKDIVTTLPSATLRVFEQKRPPTVLRRAHGVRRGGGRMVNQNTAARIRPGRVPQGPHSVGRTHPRSTTPCTRDVCRVVAVRTYAFAERRGAGTRSLLLRRRTGRSERSFRPSCSRTQGTRRKRSDSHFAGRARPRR
jgi:hypothetical protein